MSFEAEDYTPPNSVQNVITHTAAVSINLVWQPGGEVEICVSCRRVDPGIPTRDCFIHTKMEISGPWAEMRRFHVLLCNYPCRAKRYLDFNLVDWSPCGRQDISVVSTILPPELAWLPWRCSVGLCLHAQPSLCGDHRVSVPWGRGIHVLTYFYYFSSG